MNIDGDVLTTAKKWGLDPKLLQAVVNAEGDILKAVQCSLPTVQTRQGALEVTARSCTHAMSDFIQQYHFAPTFVAFWGARWAPIGVSNDPEGLNANWVKNVSLGWVGTTS